MWTVPGEAQETGRPCARSCARAVGRGCLGTAPVNSVYVFDDRVVLNINFTDDAKTVTREEVLGSSAVDNAPPHPQTIRSGDFFVADGTEREPEQVKAGYHYGSGILPFAIFNSV